MTDGSACRRCSAPLPAAERARLGGICLACAWAVAADDDPPELPNLEILSLIGRGGMGRVYRARQVSLGRTVALKVIAPALAADPDFLRRFEREARTLAQLSHPGVVTVFDFGVHEGAPYLVMEHVEGVSLRSLLTGTPLEAGRAAGIASRLCDALEYAHSRGVTHRDLKPENVLLAGDGSVKLADFGLALISDDAGRLSGTQVKAGTPRYMAPEQIEQPERVDRRADLYALGVLLYEMLTGRLPLGRFDPPSQSNPAAAPLDEVVLALLERDPARRPASAADVKRRLAPPKGRSRLGLAAAALIGLAAIVGLAWPRLRPVEEPPKPPSPPPAPPRWEELAGSGSGGGLSATPEASTYPSVAVDGEGRPVVAWNEASHPSRNHIWVRRWNGRSWEPLGGSDTGYGISGTELDGTASSISIDPKGHPVIAWRAGLRSIPAEVYLKRWDGSAWVELEASASGGGVSRTPGNSFGLNVALDRQGHPVVAWHDNLGSVEQIYVRRWDGRAWKELDGSAGGGGLSRTPGSSIWPVLVVDPQDRLHVVWSCQQYVYYRRWNGSTWEELGGSASGSGIATGRGAGIAVDGQGNPVVVWSARVGSAEQIHLRRWNGRAWEELGGSATDKGLSRTEGTSVWPRVALDPAGRPIVAWEEKTSSGTHIYARFWDGAAWVEAAGSGSGHGLSATLGNSFKPALAVDSTGRAFVVWFEAVGSGAEIYGRRLSVPLGR